MTQHHDLSTPGGWWLAIAGWSLGGWQWAVGDMPPLSAALTLATLVLTIIKVAGAWHRWRRPRARAMMDNPETEPLP